MFSKFLKYFLVLSLSLAMTQAISPASANGSPVLMVVSELSASVKSVTLGNTIEIVIKGSDNLLAGSVTTVNSDISKATINSSVDAVSGLATFTVNGLALGFSDITFGANGYTGTDVRILVNLPSVGEGDIVPCTDSIRGIVICFESTSSLQGPARGPNPTPSAPPREPIPFKLSYTSSGDGVGETQGQLELAVEVVNCADSNIENCTDLTGEINPLAPLTGDVGNFIISYPSAGLFETKYEQLKRSTYAVTKAEEFTYRKTLLGVNVGGGNPEESIEFSIDMTFFKVFDRPNCSFSGSSSDPESGIQAATPQCAQANTSDAASDSFGYIWNSVDLFAGGDAFIDTGYLNVSAPYATFGAIPASSDELGAVSFKMVGPKYSTQDTLNPGVIKTYLPPDFVTQVFGIQPDNAADPVVQGERLDFADGVRTSLDVNADFTAELDDDGGLLITGSNTFSAPAFILSSTSRARLGSSAVPSETSSPSSASPIAVVPSPVIALIITNPAKLKVAKFRQYTAEQLATVPAAIFKRFPNRILKRITSSQARGLTSAQLKALSPQQVALLSGSVIGALNASQISALQPKDFVAMSIRQVSKISSLGAAGLRAKQFNALSNAKLRRVNRDAIANLAPKTLRVLSANRLNRLTKRQKNAITTDQRLALTSKKRQAVS